MSTVRFQGCLHLGHRNMAKFRGFENEYSHDAYLIEQWNKVVHKKDLTYILGDVTMENPKNYCLLDELNGRKIVVLGNHDMPKHVRQLLNHVESVAGMVDYKGYCLTHAPIHPMELGRYLGNIHAHIHHKNKIEELEVKSHYQDNDNKILTKDKYFCVDAKLLDFKPVTLNELIYGRKT
jgi:calcineurin-like phosphoesterase family protein